MASAGVVGVDGDDYDPATSSGISKLFADAFAASFGDFQPGAVDNAGKRSIEAMASALAQALTQEVVGTVPVGAIVAWHKSLTGVPSLPSNFAQCDGQLVDDIDSPLNGQTLPNLNGANSVFIGGANGTDGSSSSVIAPVVESHSHSMQSHTHNMNNHTHSMQGHTHSMQSHTHQPRVKDSGSGGTAGSDGASDTSGYTLTTLAAVETGVPSSASTGGPSSASTAGPSTADTAGPSTANTGTYGSGTESAPRHVKMVWIMRIK